MNPIGPGGTFSIQVRSASSVSPKLNSPPPMRASQPVPGMREMPSAMFGFYLPSAFAIVSPSLAGFSTT